MFLNYFALVGQYGKLSQGLDTSIYCQIILILRIKLWMRKRQRLKVLKKGYASGYVAFENLCCVNGQVA
jgi:hypothetical protein